LGENLKPKPRKGNTLEVVAFELHLVGLSMVYKMVVLVLFRMALYHTFQLLQ